jgi:hypothetical protein
MTELEIFFVAFGFGELEIATNRSYSISISFISWEIELLMSCFLSDINITMSLIDAMGEMDNVL